MGRQPAKTLTPSLRTTFAAALPMLTTNFKILSGEVSPHRGHDQGEFDQVAQRDANNEQAHSCGSTGGSRQHQQHTCNAANKTGDNGHPFLKPNQPAFKGASENVYANDASDQSKQNLR